VSGRIPLRWVEGDRCAIRRDGELLIGRIEGLVGRSAYVRLNEWRMVVAGIDELELVPFAQATTIPAPPAEESEQRGGE